MVEASLDKDKLLGEVNDDAADVVLDFADGLEEDWSVFLPEGVRKDEYFTRTPFGMSRTILDEELYVNMQIHKTVMEPDEKGGKILTIRACSVEDKISTKVYFTQFGERVSNYSDFKMGRSVSNSAMRRVESVGVCILMDVQEFEYETPEGKGSYTADELENVAENALQSMTKMKQKYGDMSHTEIENFILERQ